MIATSMRAAGAAALTGPRAPAQRSPSIGPGSGDGWRGLGSAGEHERPPGTRRRGAAASHDNRGRSEPLGHPQDSRLRAAPKGEGDRAVAVLGRRPRRVPLYSRKGREEIARRSRVVVRPDSNVGYLAVLGAAHVAHHGFVPRCCELREPDGTDQRHREQPGRQRRARWARARKVAPVITRTSEHRRPISLVRADRRPVKDRLAVRPQNSRCPRNENTQTGPRSAL